jgi:hypothetical protein
VGGLDTREYVSCQLKRSDGKTNHNRDAFGYIALEKGWLARLPVLVVVSLRRETHLSFTALSTPIFLLLSCHFCLCSDWNSITVRKEQMASAVGAARSVFN